MRITEGTTAGRVSPHLELSKRLFSLFLDASYKEKAIILKLLASNTLLTGTT
jgi:hypothetical protein